MKKIIVAIDGYSGCGKSTLAKDLALKLNYLYIDSGAMYRAVSYFAIENGFINNGSLNSESLLMHLDEIKIDFIKSGDNNCIFLNGKNIDDKIRSLEVSKFVSEIAAISKIRTKMVKAQKDLGKNKGIVMDGRDIGTVVFPDAEVKFFVTADIEVRIQRRILELTNKGNKADYEDVKNNLLHRDRIDSTRKDSPLRQSKDAIVIDNTNITKTEQLELAYNYVIEKIKNDSRN